MVEVSPGEMRTPWLTWLEREGLAGDTDISPVLSSDGVEIVAEIAALFVAHGAYPFKLTRVIDPELHASLQSWPKSFAVATWEPIVGYRFGFCQLFLGRMTYQTSTLGNLASAFPRF